MKEFIRQFHLVEAYAISEANIGRSSQVTTDFCTTEGDSICVIVWRDSVDRNIYIDQETFEKITEEARND